MKQNMLKLCAAYAATLMLGGIAVSSCMSGSPLDANDHSPTVAYTIATTKMTDAGEYYFLSDAGNTIFPVNLDGMDYEPKDGQRIYADFSELDEEMAGYDYVVNVMFIQDILTKDIFPITEATQDSIGDDRAEFLYYWLTDEYLTIQFLIGGNPDSGILHMINLVEDASSITEEFDPYLNLEFRHNANGDHPYHQLTGLVSFRLPSVAGKTGMKIRVNTPLNSAKIYTIDFDEVAASKRTVQASEVQIN